jgi:hypothetical protein
VKVLPLSAFESKYLTMPVIFKLAAGTAITATYPEPLLFWQSRQ